MASNKALHRAKAVKNDEFYTRYDDIDKIIPCYAHHLKDKVLYCNCDNPAKSQFYLWFKKHFKQLGLKAVIATYYTEGEETSKVTLLEYDSNYNPVEYSLDIETDGDFRSQPCMDILSLADIVITNPPFSLINLYIKQLMESRKQFLILGPIMAALYKDIFPLIIERKLKTWGHTPYITFDTPDGPKRLNLVIWFSNIDPINKQDWIKTLSLTKKYSPEAYPYYDDTDIISVKKFKDIPMDYTGLMAVPITFLPFIDYNQFELIGCLSHGIDHKYDLHKPIIQGKETYKRLVIKFR